MGVLKSPRLKVLQLCGTIISYADLRSGWGLNRNCNRRWELSNDVLHATCMQGNRVDSQLFVVGSQTINLTLDLSFGHNLCCRCPNGSCKPIWTYVLITLQWYNKFLKARGFDLCNCFLKFRESTKTPIPKMGVHLGGWVFILTLSHTPRLLFWPTLLRTLALVMSLRLGLRQKPITIKYFHIL
jgi:hypothetical protein